jgi:hypothetical protein
MGCLAQQYSTTANDIDFYSLPYGDLFGTFSPCAMTDSLKVYEVPSVDSTVLAYMRLGHFAGVYSWGIKADTHFNINDNWEQLAAMDFAKINHENAMWFYVRYGQHMGYVKATEIAESCFSIITEDFASFNFIKNKPDGAVLYRYAPKEARFTDTVALPLKRVDMAKNNYWLDWKNNQQLLILSENDPIRKGIIRQVYMADANGRSEIIYVQESLTEQDSTEQSVFNVFFPIRTSTGKTHEFRLFTSSWYFQPNIFGLRYFANGRTLKNKFQSRLLDWSFPFPQKICVKRKNRFLVFESTAVFDTDKTGKLIREENGSRKVKMHKHKRHFYRWNGETLEIIGVKIEPDDVF